MPRRYSVCSPRQVPFLSKERAPQHPYNVRAPILFARSTDFEPLTEVPDHAAKDTESRLSEFNYCQQSHGPTRMPSQAVYVGEWERTGL